MNNRQTDIKGKRNVRGSVYPGAAPSPDVNESEARIWETVHDLIELARQPVGLEDVMNWNPTPDVMPDLTQMLEKEAARAMRDPKGRSSLVASAKRNIEQAYMISKVRNPRVLARFAVEMAYDYHYRLNVSATLDGTWVRRWKNGHDWINCYPGYPEQGLPIRQDELAMLGWSTARYAAEKLPADNIVEPYEGLKPTFGWAIDPTRPPISAVRAGAEVIRREFGNSRIRMYAVELGHNAAAEALVSFLPEATVYTESFTFPHRADTCFPDEGAAVVLGLPNRACVEYVKRAIDPDDPLNRWDNDRFWNWPKMEQLAGLVDLVHDAIDRVQPGGALIVIGDVESGSHHVANSTIAYTGRFTPIPVGGNTVPVMFRYSRPPWGPFGVIPPTNRMVSAWRRIA